MKYKQHVLDMINNATLHTEPHEYLFIENFLDDDDYDILRKDFADKDWISKIAYNRVDYFTEDEVENGDRDHCYNHGCGWDEYMEFVESEEFIETLCNKFKCESILPHLKYVAHEYLLDMPEHYIPIHEDSDGSEVPVFQISVFLPDKDYDEFGTILYKDEQGNGELETPMKKNSALIYGTNPKQAWHGTKPGDRIRKSLLTRYRTTVYK